MRQLAAILFADMTGYTALVQENEQLAREKRKRLKIVLESVIAKYNGRILQNYGDGSLSIFNSAIDSVQCAIELQTTLTQSPKVEVRIGIHSGDITIDGDAIYGDGVNVASRIESLSISGGIFISEKVYDEIRNQEGIRTREMGYFEFKNVRQPLRVFAVINPGIAVPERNELRGKTAQPVNRLAVLPFVNMSADPENEYFSDGITEELLNALTRVNGLQVTSRTSSFAFKGKNDDIRDIALKLNVDKILEGSVRKSGNRVRITAQLINAGDGYHIWSETYDRDLTDIFEMQDEISAIIANKLKKDLASSEAQGSKAATHNLTAYTLYLKGLHYLNKLTPADKKKAAQSFEGAFAIEPTYAQAYAMAASCYSSLGSSGQMSPQKAFGIVHKYADIALKLDDEVAEGHIAKASAYLHYEWKWKEGFDSLKRGLALNPSSVDGHELLGFYYILTGQKDKAVKVLEEASMIDPLSPIITLALGTNYIFAERYDEAVMQADKLLEMDPSMRRSIEMKGWAIGMKGNWEAALPYFEKVHQLTGHPLKGLMGLGFCYGKLGLRDKAMECIHKMEERQRMEPDSVIDADLGAVWFGLGDYDRTFFYIHECIRKKMGPVSYFLEYPAYKGIKDDPRYAEIMKQLGF